MILPINLAAVEGTAEHHLVRSPTVVRTRAVRVQGAAKFRHSEQRAVVARRFARYTNKYCNVTQRGPAGIDRFTNVAAELRIAVPKLVLRDAMPN